MYFALDELCCRNNNRIEEEMTYPETTFVTSMGEFPILQASPLQLELFHSEKKVIDVTGKMKLVVGIPCDRCLKEVAYDFSVSFQKHINLNEQILSDDFDDTQYVKDSTLNLGKIIRDEILLQWPVKVLCKEDCKGMCKICGHDLNVGDCGCDRDVLDPRMAAIRDIFKNAK